MVHDSLLLQPFAAAILDVDSDQPDEQSQTWPMYEMVLAVTIAMPSVRRRLRATEKEGGEDGSESNMDFGDEQKEPAECAESL